MTIWLAVAVYLAGYVAFVIWTRRTQTNWHWAPILIASLGWPWLLAIRLAALWRYHVMKVR